MGLILAMSILPIVGEGASTFEKCAVMTAGVLTGYAIVYIVQRFGIKDVLKPGEELYTLKQGLHAIYQSIRRKLANIKGMRRKSKGTAIVKRGERSQFRQRG